MSIIETLTCEEVPMVGNDPHASPCIDRIKATVRLAEWNGEMWWELFGIEIPGDENEGRDARFMFLWDAVERYVDRNANSILGDPKTYLSEYAA